MIPIMLDYKFIRDNIEAVQRSIEARNVKADAALVARLYDERNEAIATLEALRKKRNDNAQAMKGKLDAELRAALIEDGKALKESIAKAEEALEGLEARLRAEASRVPNMLHPEVPLGKEEKDNLEVARHGLPTKFSFKPRDHVELGALLDIIDFEAGSKVAGSKFTTSRRRVFLELALVRYALDILKARGFDIYATPDIAREEILEGVGFSPRGEESNIYPLEGTGTCLIGTAEITLGGYYADSVLDVEALPIRMGGVSHCFRREAGAAGQFSKGLYRVHQFTKVEMFAICEPEASDAMHEQLRQIEEEVFKGLGIPFRVVDTCSGDLGAPAYRKWDLEAWMPGRGDGEWGEVTSTSNCTDYQARRLNVRYKADGKNRHVHMLNGTAIACSRAIIAILENFQEEDGSVKIPERLRPYTGFDFIRPKA